MNRLMRARMGRKTLFRVAAIMSFLLMVATAHLTGCAVVNKDESHGVRSDGYVTTDSPGNTPALFRLDIRGDLRHKMVVPLLYHKTLRSVPPYRMFLNVLGTFDEIVSINVELIANGTERIPTEFDPALISKSYGVARRVEGEEDMYSFGHRSIAVDLPAEDVEPLVASVRFVARKGEAEIVHTVEIEFIKIGYDEFYGPIEGIRRILGPGSM